jgi:hypothetical protein
MLRIAAMSMGFIAAAASAQTWHAERLTAGGGAPPRVERLWSKGAWLRAEVTLGGHPIQTFVKGDRYVIVDALTNKGISIQRSAKSIAEDAKRGRPFAQEQRAIVAAGGEKVKTEGQGAGACDLYRLTDQAGRREVCVSTSDDKVPLVARAWNRQSGTETELTYLAWAKDVPADDAFFAPDPRAQLESFTTDAYVAKAREGAVGPAPVLYPELLLGN